MSERILNIESLSPANEVEMVYKVAGSYKKETALVDKNDFILLPNFLKENLLKLREKNWAKKRAYL